MIDMSIHVKFYLILATYYTIHNFILSNNFTYNKHAT